MQKAVIKTNACPQICSLMWVEKKKERWTNKHQLMSQVASEGMLVISGVFTLGQRSLSLQWSAVCAQAYN